MKKALALALVLVLAASFAACGGAPGGEISSAVSASLPQSSSSAAPPAGKVAAPPLAPEDIVPWVYAIPLDDPPDGEVVIVNQDGKEVMRGENMEILYDLLTGEPAAITPWRTLGTPGETHLDPDYYGNCESALYSLSGEMLQDWAPGVFMCGFGAYVIHASRRLGYIEFGPKALPAGGFESALVQMNTGEAVLEGAYELTVFSNGTMAVGNATMVLGVIDASLNRVAGFPMRRDYYAIFEWEGTGRYLADAVQPMSPYGEITGYVLNADFSEQTAFPGWQMTGHDGMGGGCLLRSTSWMLDDNVTTVTARELVDAGTGEVTLDLSGMGFSFAAYYDGEVMVAASETKREEGGSRYNYALTTADGAVIADGFETLHALLEDTPAEADVFAGIRDGALVLVNRAGDILKRSVPGSYAIVSYYGPDNSRLTLAEPRFIVSGDTEAVLFRGHYRALYDMELNELIPLGIYEELSPLARYPIGNKPYPSLFLTGRRQQEGSEDVFVYDILDLDGNLLIEGLDRVYSGNTNQRLVAEAGGFAGLMDLSGNWMWKEPWKPNAG